VVHQLNGGKSSGFLKPGHLTDNRCQEVMSAKVGIKHS
jgi:hypothetical protein